MRALMTTGPPSLLVPVFVIFVPSAPTLTCDATWWLKAYREATDAGGAPR